MRVEGRAAAWTLLGVVIGFKVIGAVLIFIIAPSSETVTILIALNWPYVLIGALALAPPALLLTRLVRARRRRAEFIRAEWHVEQTEDEPHEH